MSAETACQVMGGVLANAALSKRRWRGVSVDTRTLHPGNAFFCLQGENSDGHRFVSAAVKQGAGLIVAERGRALRWRNWSLPVIGVDDPLTALGDLAAAYRGTFSTRYVAVTGSVGKTTTKELIAAVLSSRGRVFKSPGNFNNLIGIPLAILGHASPGVSACALGVLEFGMSTPGEIARLTRIVAPSWGVVTRIGAGHLMQMKSVAAVARAKRELFDYASPGLAAFLNIDDPYQCGWMAHWRRHTVTYGVDRAQAADFFADEITATARGLRFRVNRRHRFELALAGEYNVPNALAAIAVGRHLGITFDAMIASLRRARGAAHRSRIVREGGVVVIEDCYNANPTSMLAALASLTRWPAPGRRIAVLGAMRELGESSRRWHQRVGRAADSLDAVVTVGRDARAFHPRTGRAEWRNVPDRGAAVAALRKTLRPGDVVLLKASHAEAFEEIAVKLRGHLMQRPRPSR
ncbi:MAG: UDP-N-acetylmuramoyl-tripeptide--D-alanyl-D-alanine ligase [Candidatus Zixiibacteriota bacterium]